MKNFGGNIIFNPVSIYAPQTENEVLDILNKHNNNKIRVIGSLHAWSEVAVSDDVLIDLKYINGISIEKDRNGNSWAIAGGGCVLEKLTGYLNKAGLTMPALGAIQRQTVAGAISTGTHGSGNQSISHHMNEIRIAAYDPVSGAAKIYEFKEGEDLRAARCSVGCMGVILSVKFKCPKDYWIEEKTSIFKNISDVLNGGKEYPLQQFGLIPFRWEYFAYQRRVTNNIPKGLDAVKMSFLKLVDYFATEILTHFIIKNLANFSNGGVNGEWIKWFYKDFIVSFINQRTVAYKSIRTLTLHTSHHNAFQHLEIEIFIPKIHVVKAAEVIRWVTTVFSGERHIPEEIISEVKRTGMFNKLMEYKGSYTQHYPLFFRRVFADDTLISMASGNQTYYAVGFFTYLHPDARERFYNFAAFMAELLEKLFDARLHWGKYFPLANKNIEHLYPKLSVFRQICDKVDPKGVFQNEFTKKVLGFK